MTPAAPAREASDSVQASVSRADRSTGPAWQGPARWWIAIVVPMWLVCVWCAHFEPIVRDSWGHLHWYRFFDFTVDNLITYAKGQYVHNNPRLGQVVTLLAFAPGPWHEIVTPIVEVGMFVLLTAHVLGRWPSLRNGDDALAFATVSALVVACSPVIGHMLFYRPFTGNYLFGFVLDLALLLPYRFHHEAVRPPTWEIPRAVGWLVLGFAAGMCNEHTGPAVALLALIVTGLAVRGGTLRAWMLAGLVGVVAGWIVLIAAPGHEFRYGGIAKEAGLLERIVDRGVVMDLWLAIKPGLYLLVAIPWLVVGAIARRKHGPGEMTAATRRALQAGGAAGLVMALTLLGSPKDGERLYFATVVLGAAAIGGWVVAQVRAVPALRRACAVLSAAALLFVAERCVETLYVVGVQSQERLELLRAAPPGSTVTVPRYTRGLTRWFVGEDLDDGDRHKNVARDFGLTDIQLR
jgi:hypothetical protein